MTRGKGRSSRLMGGRGVGQPSSLREFSFQFLNDLRIDDLIGVPDLDRYSALHFHLQNETHTLPFNGNISAYGRKVEVIGTTSDGAIQAEPTDHDFHSRLFLPSNQPARLHISSDHSFHLIAGGLERVFGDRQAR